VLFRSSVPGGGEEGVAFRGSGIEAVSSVAAAMTASAAPKAVSRRFGWRIARVSGGPQKERRAEGPAFRWSSIA
jgi:hypothetical protein